MPEAWSSEYDRERARDMKASKDAGASDPQAKQEADAAWATDTDEPRGRRVAD